MKRLLTFALICGASLFAADNGPRVIVSAGLWSLCANFPQMYPQFCVPSGAETWTILVRSAGDDPSVIGYRLLLHYTDKDGKEGSRVIIVNREQLTWSAYSSDDRVLGQIKTYRIELTPIMAAGPSEILDAVLGGFVSSAQN
jgi:hypothetical protein